ncbi:MAG TPA: DUF4440 domain-containing protein [Thermoanaerobaculia bacterium]|nr:DUF4440 domain-containing protein [Thermoanaerobaculia bacterium]
MIQFSGSLTPSVVEDIRRLYLRGNAFLRFFLLIFGVFLAGLSIASRPSPDGFLLALAGICLIAAMFLHRIWWHWWLATARPAPDTKVEGAITEEGLNLPNGVLQWAKLTGVKVGAEAILFYTSKSDFIPVHRTMVPSLEAWHEAQEIPVRYVGRLRRFVDNNSVRALLIVTLLVAASAAGQQEAPAAEPSVSLPPELARVLTDYEAAWSKKDPAALAGLFAADGFVLPNGSTPVRGRAAIQKYYTGHGGPLSLRAIAYAAEGGVGYIIGGYTDTAGKPDIGKFTLTLRKGADGRWLIMSDMDNSNRRRE